MERRKRGETAGCCRDGDGKASPSLPAAICTTGQRGRAVGTGGTWAQQERQQLGACKGRGRGWKAARQGGESSVASSSSYLDTGGFDAAAASGAFWVRWGRVLHVGAVGEDRLSPFEHCPCLSGTSNLKTSQPQVRANSSRLPKKLMAGEKMVINQVMWLDRTELHPWAFSFGCNGLSRVVIIY